MPSFPKPPPKEKKPRKGLKRTGFTKKTSYPILGKKGERNGNYTELRKEYLKRHLRCEMGGVAFECNPLKPCFAMEIHHTMGRQGQALIDVNGWLATGRPCHEWVESNREEAYELGLLRKRNVARDSKGEQGG